MKYLLFLLLTIFLLVGARGSNLEKITPWLLGANFTISIFSINFTFFGYQLSKYKAIYTNISKRQWFNIIALLILPFIPLIAYLCFPKHFSLIALGVLPISVLSSIDNASLTSKYLDLRIFISNLTREYVITKYLKLLSENVKNEVAIHNDYLKNKDKFQIPPHGYSFEPTILGLESCDIWDSITVATNLSVKNNDYSMFRVAISAVLSILIKSYSYNSGNDNYQIDSGVRTITKKRFRSIINHIVDTDPNGIFLQSLSGELCDYLLDEKFSNNPCSDMTRAIASEAIWIGQKMLESDCPSEPLKIINTIQSIIEINLHRLETSDSSNFQNGLDKLNIPIYAHDIKTLSIAAIDNNNSHFAYRCMESLSYLGCNAAKLKAKETVAAVLESIVHIGRVSRNQGIGCFWSKCLIPIESHAEEFLGHILTWQIVDIDELGNFFMKDYTEQAYSRLRGIKCIIRPKSNSRPISWIEELKKDNKAIPHIEYQSGMYGYSGELDYSDFNNLKEYTLYGIGSEKSARMFYSEPMPLNINGKDSEDAE